MQFIGYCDWCIANYCLKVIAHLHESQGLMYNLHVSFKAVQQDTRQKWKWNSDTSVSMLSSDRFIKIQLFKTCLFILTTEHQPEFWRPEQLMCPHSSTHCLERNLQQQKILLWSLHSIRWMVMERCSQWDSSHPCQMEHSMQCRPPALPNRPTAALKVGTLWGAFLTRIEVRVKPLPDHDSD